MLVAAQVGAVGDHDRAAHADGEERLSESGEHGVGAYGREVRAEEIGERLRRRAAGDPGGERIDAKRGQHDEEQRHEDDDHLLDAARQSPRDDDDGERHEEGVPENPVGDRVVERQGRAGARCALGELAQKRHDRIGHDLTGDEAIGGQDQKARDHAGPAGDRPSRRAAGVDGEIARRPDGREALVPAHRQLGDEHGEGDEDDAEDVDEDERRAAVLPRLEREPPQIAEPDGRPDRGHQKREARRPVHLPRC